MIDKLNENFFQQIPNTLSHSLALDVFLLLPSFAT